MNNCIVKAARIETLEARYLGNNPTPREKHKVEMFKAAYEAEIRLGSHLAQDSYIKNLSLANLSKHEGKIL